MAHLASHTSRTARSWTRSRACVLGATAAVVLLMGGCSDDDDEASTPVDSAPAPSATATASESATADAVTGSLTAADQSGDGTSLTIEEVTIEGAGGWIALHIDQGGAPGPVVGFVQIPEGTSSDVEVKGDEKLATGAYWPMLHTDTGKLGTYEFGETKGAEDAPVLSGGTPVMKKITYTAE